MSWTKDTYAEELEKDFSDADIQPFGMHISLNNKGQIMSLNIPEQSGDNFKMLQAGSYPARCIRVVDLGTQLFEYNGDVKTPHKIMLIFELPTELIQDKNGEMKPMLQSKEYTLSMHEKANLRQDLENWRGRNFSDTEAYSLDLRKLIGASCALSVIHKNSKGRTYANIGSINPLMKGAECPEQVHSGFYYEIEEGQSDNYAALPEWIRRKIDAAQENLVQHNQVAEMSEEEYNQIPSKDLPF